MHYTSRYQSPLGEILLAADNIGLTGLWFYGQKYFALHLDKSHEEKPCPVLEQAKLWLNIYFSGQNPDLSVPLHLEGTEFQKEVWEILLDIPYGTTVTYGKIAAVLAQKRGLEHMSAQAVGNADVYKRQFYSILVLTVHFRSLAPWGKLFQLFI